MAVGYFSHTDFQTGNINAPDSTPLDVTGDIEIICLVRPTDANITYGLLGKGSGGGNRSYYFKTLQGTTRARLRFGHYNGTAEDFASSTVELPAAWNTSDFLWVRVTLDVDNGASGYDLKFWYSTDAETTDPQSVSWTQLGSTIVGGATTSIFNSSADAQVGFTTWDTGNGFDGDYAYGGIWSGIGGTLAGEIDFRDSNVPQTDPQSNYWEQDGTGGTWTPNDQNITPGLATSTAAAYDPVVANAYVALTLTPNGDGTISGMFNELGQTTGLYASVDEWPETATDWISSGETDGSAFFDLTATPANFGLMKTLRFEGYGRNSAFGTDTCDLYAQVFKSDETTPLTDELLLGDETLDGLVDLAFTINATGLAATKGDWDAARVKIREDYTP